MNSPRTHPQQTYDMVSKSRIINEKFIVIIIIVVIVTINS